MQALGTKLVLDKDRFYTLSKCRLSDPIPTLKIRISVTKKIISWPKYNVTSEKTM